MKLFNTIFLISKYTLLLFILIYNNAISQTTVISPYSRYGIGEVNRPVFTRNFSMGSLGIAMQNDSLAPFFINMINPASYAGITGTVLEAGAVGNSINHQTSTTKFTSNNASVAYLSLQIPVKKWWGTSVGIVPFSGIGYHIKDSKDTAGIGYADYQYNGGGGINQFYWGNSFKIRNFSAGLNASYLFGNIVNSRKVIFSDTSNSYNFASIKTINISDFYFNYGMLYTIKIDSVKNRELKEKVKIILGATFAPSTGINSKSNIFSYTYLDDYQGVRDTIENYENKKGAIALPLNMGYGITFKKGEKWIIGAEYAIQQWSNFSVFGINSDFKNSNNISLGGQYVPGSKSESSKTFWQGVNYRAGIRYSQTYLDLKNTSITEHALSIGFGIPVAKIRQLQQYSMFNIGFEIGERGTTDNGLIKENFVKIMLGITMNDKWFNKPKID